MEPWMRRWEKMREMVVKQNRKEALIRNMEVVLERHFEKLWKKTENRDMDEEERRKEEDKPATVLPESQLPEICQREMKREILPTGCTTKIEVRLTQSNTATTTSHERQRSINTTVGVLKSAIPAPDNVTGRNVSPSADVFSFSLSLDAISPRKPSDNNQTPVPAPPPPPKPPDRILSTRPPQLFDCINLQETTLQQSDSYTTRGTSSLSSVNAKPNREGSVELMAIRKTEHRVVPSPSPEPPSSDLQVTALFEPKPPDPPPPEPPNSDPLATTTGLLLTDSSWSRIKAESSLREQPWVKNEAAAVREKDRRKESGAERQSRKYTRWRFVDGKNQRWKRSDIELRHRRIPSTETMTDK